MSNGTQLKARPTTYNGIEMRSRLEARYAAWLDSMQFQWTYEPKCFATEQGQYLPDFLVQDVHIFGRPRDVFIEVKPLRSLFTEEDFTRVTKIINASHPDAWFILEAADESDPWAAWPAAYNAPFYATRAQWSRSRIPIGPVLTFALKQPWREVA